jgi:hypothetical protein
MPPIVIAGAIAAGGAIIGGAISSKSVSKAADATQQSANAATAEAKRQYDQTRADQLPWLETGKSALDQLSGMYGIGPQAGTAQPNADFYKSPDYNFRLNEGIKGVDAGAAARGSLDSGATRKAEISFAGNLASGEFSSYANRLAALAGVGQTAASNLGNLGSQYASNVGNIAINQGNNRASSYLAQGQNYGNTIGNIAGIGSGLIMNNPSWFTPKNASYNTGSGNWTPGPGGF